jgi:hypothetical protein
MHNQYSARKMPTSNSKIAPQPQNWVTHATLRSHHAFLILLTICVLVIGLTVRAQDFSKQQQSQDSAKQQDRIRGRYPDYWVTVPGSFPMRKMATCFSMRRT